MKKLYNLIGCFIICVLFCGVNSVWSVQADMVWEPRDDFYKEHYQEGEYIGRYFIANSRDGYVYSYSEPGSSEKIEFIPNGTSCYISFTYALDDKIWGIVTKVKGDEGWVDMDDFYVVYDNTSFIEEYKEEIVNAEDAEKVDFKIKGTTLFRDYPNSEKYYTYYGGDIEEDANFTFLYTDEDGRLWGQIGYLYGQRDFWICITDPENTEIPARKINLPEIYEAVVTEPEHKSDFPVLPIVLVAGVVIITGALIIILTKKNKRA